MGDRAVLWAIVVAIPIVILLGGCGVSAKDFEDAQRRCVNNGGVDYLDVRAGALMAICKDGMKDTAWHKKQ